MLVTGCYITLNPKQSFRSFYTLPIILIKLGIRTADLNWFTRVTKIKIYNSVRLVGQFNLINLRKSVETNYRFY